MSVRNRIKGLRHVKASSLRIDSRNWRLHPADQVAAMRSMLDRVGYVGALIARKAEDGSLVLIDGHLRADLDPDQKVPVLITDLDESEAAEVLATYDPITGMSNVDADALASLLTGIDLPDEAQVELDRILDDNKPWDPVEDNVRARQHQPGQPSTSITVTCPSELYDEVRKALIDAVADFENVTIE